MKSYDKLRSYVPFLMPSYIFIISCLRWVIFCFLPLFSPFKYHYFCILSLNFIYRIYFKGRTLLFLKRLFMTTASVVKKFNFLPLGKKTKNFFFIMFGAKLNRILHLGKSFREITASLRRKHIFMHWGMRWWVRDISYFPWFGLPIM